MAQPKAMQANDNDRDAELKDLYAMLDILKSDMKELTKTVGDVAKTEAQRRVEATKAKGQQAKEMGEEQLAALRVQAEDFGRTTGTYVRENPTTALGIAAGIGFLIGALMTSRR